MESRKKHSPTFATGRAKLTSPGCARRLTWQPVPVGPLEVFEARRAAREVLWDLTALIDEAALIHRAARQ